MLKALNLQNKNSDWKMVRLGDMAQYINGRAFKPTEWKESGIPIIRIQNLNNADAKFNYTIDTFEERFKIKNGDLLFAWSASLGAYIWKGGDGWLNQHIFKVVSNIDTNKKFLYYLLDALVQELYSKAHGSGMVHVTKGKFENTIVPLPPISVQQAIVSKIEELFSELDKGIENLLTAQQQLKTYRQSVLKWAFEGRLTNKNVQNGEIPNNWKTILLKDVCKIIGGVTKGRNFKEKETIFLPYLRVANVQDGYLNLNDIKQIEVLSADLKKYELKQGDILYTEGGDKDKLGRGTIWKNEIENCIHQNHIFRARPVSQSTNSNYIAYFSQTRVAKDYFFRNGKQTTNLASINLKVLSNLPLPICSVDEQQEVVREIESRLSIVMKLQETIENGLEHSKILKSAILKKAFEGALVL